MVELEVRVTISAHKVRGRLLWESHCHDNCHVYVASGHHSANRLGAHSRTPVNAIIVDDASSSWRSIDIQRKYSMHEDDEG